MGLNPIFVCGLGAVSPAGWDLAALREALQQGEPLPSQPLERPGWNHALKCLAVPAPSPRPAFLTHPRLRRVSPITQYAAGAAIQATAGLGSNREKGGRLGIIVCLQAGCVQYTHRFFAETLNDPTTASPLLFPETVFAAPASHVAVLQKATVAYTLLGDPASYLSGLAVASGWLQSEMVDTCLVIGAEETNWLLADALWLFEHSTTISAGAGAVCLTNDPALSIGVELERITDAHTFVAGTSRNAAAKAMRSQLPASSPNELLFDGCGKCPRMNAAETAAWADWTGSRISIKQVLGEGLMAAAAWQCLLACDAVASGGVDAANVSLVGSNQQALGARFVPTKAYGAD